jgi:mono/diheme cytochrome c family protein
LKARIAFGVVSLLGGGAAASLLWVELDRNGSTGPSAERLERGQAIYAENCASCHGAELEGQPNWRRRLPTGRMPAPPHDASGHTWHHPDDVLFRITKEGPAAVVGGSYESDMPGFGGVLSDDEILAVLAFIESTWPERERTHQAEISRREKEGNR